MSLVRNGGPKHVRNSPKWGSGQWSEIEVRNGGPIGPPFGLIRTGSEIGPDSDSDSGKDSRGARASIGIEWHPVLRCGLVKIELFGEVVILTLPDGNCTDMEGAIELAGTVCPGVRLVVTYSGTALDTCYGLVRGTWGVLDGERLLTILRSRRR